MDDRVYIVVESNLKGQSITQMDDSQVIRYLDCSYAWKEAKKQFERGMKVGDVMKYPDGVIFCSTLNSKVDI